MWTARLQAVGRAEPGPNRPSQAGPKSHRRQEPFLVARKTYTKPSTFVKYAIKFVSGANVIANSKFAEQYAKNNKANQIF